MLWIWRDKLTGKSSWTLLSSGRALILRLEFCLNVVSRNVFLFINTFNITTSCCKSLEIGGFVRYWLALAYCQLLTFIHTTDTLKGPQIGELKLGMYVFTECYISYIIENIVCSKCFYLHGIGRGLELYRKCNFKYKNKNKVSVEINRYYILDNKTRHLSWKASILMKPSRYSCTSSLQQYHDSRVPVKLKHTTGIIHCWRSTSNGFVATHI